MKMDFKTILKSLPSFIEDYQKFLIARNSIREMKIDVIGAIEKFSTRELQEDQIKIMVEQARGFLADKAIIEVEGVLNVTTN